MDSNKDFHQSMHQLVELLKKVIVHLPFPSLKEPSSMPGKDQNINVNFCFFNFLPITPEEADELEDIYDDFLMHHEDRMSELRTDLTVADVEFLKRNGIRF